MTLPITQFVQRPGIIDLTWGHPAPELLPVRSMTAAVTAAFEKYGSAPLHYGSAAGPGPLLDWLARKIGREEGRAPAPEEIMITGGSSFGLELLLTHFTRPGDTVLVELPTYHIALQALRDHGLDLQGVPVDGEGLDVDALPALLKSLRKKGRTVPALYTVPTFHNPTGTTLSLARRRRLAEIAAAESLLIIEDDVYRDLYFSAPPPPSLWSLAAPGAVTRLGSFSKTIAPGLRLGWLTAGQPMIKELVTSGLLESGGGVSHFAATVVSTVCESGEYERSAASLRQAYGARQQALRSGLMEQLPEGCSLNSPDGGFFLWLTLPGHLSAEGLLERAESQGVSYLPGNVFCTDHSAGNALRLSFSLYGPELLAEAGRKLSRLIATAARTADPNP